MPFIEAPFSLTLTAVADLECCLLMVIYLKVDLVTLMKVLFFSRFLLIVYC